MPNLKCPKCGDLDGKHIEGCKLRRPIFASQHLTPDEQWYVDQLSNVIGYDRVATTGQGPAAAVSSALLPTAPDHGDIIPKATRTQHTPEPWRIDPDDDSTWRILGPGERGDYLNEIAELSYTGSNSEANAHLIAAAPALLAALENLLRDACTHGFGQCLSDSHGIARDALALARGTDA